MTQTLPCMYLEVSVFDLQYVGDVEWPMFGVTGLLHGLRVDVPRRGHEEHVAAFLAEDERRVTDLATGEQEVVLRTDGIRRQVVDLHKVCRHNGQLCLGARQPHCLDDEVTCLQGWVQH